MIIDNSRAQAFRTCPYLYFELYEREGTGIEPKPVHGEGYSPLEFGARVHEILEAHYKGKDYLPPHANFDLESEANSLMAAYLRHYPVEDFEVVDVERVFKVELPNTHHIYTGKIDLLIRNPNGRLSIMDHKTEGRTSKSNLPQKWAARDQASLYLYAAERIYGEPMENFIVNILTRASDGGRKPPSFPDRQKLERTPKQIEIAVRDLILIADQIEEYRERFKGEDWPSTKENCYTWGKCAFYDPHTFGWDALMREHKFQPRKEYLNLDNVETTR